MASAVQCKNAKDEGKVTCVLVCPLCVAHLSVLQLHKSTISPHHDQSLTKGGLLRTTTQQTIKQMEALTKESISLKWSFPHNTFLFLSFYFFDLFSHRFLHWFATRTLMHLVTLLVFYILHLFRGIQAVKYALHVG